MLGGWRYLLMFRPAHARSSRLLLSALALAFAVGGCGALDKSTAEKRGKDRPGVVKPIRVTKAKTKPGEAAVQQAVPGIEATGRGTQLAEQGMFKEALEAFELAIQENPLLVSAYLGAGDSHEKLGENIQAERRFGEAARIEPGNFIAQYRHARILQKLARFEESIRAYLRALALRPNDFDANNNLGMAYLQVGEPNAALTFSRKAVEIKPDDGGARTNLGVVYSSLNQHENAVVELQQAAELTEPNAKLLLNLANAYGFTGKFEEMVNTLDQVVRLEPSAPAYERLGYAYWKTREVSNALEAYRKAVDIDPNHYPAHNGLGVCLLTRWVSSGQENVTDKEDGVRALRRSLQIERNQPRVLELLGRYK
jgi:superkiller protein 3